VVAIKQFHEKFKFYPGQVCVKIPVENILTGIEIFTSKTLEESTNGVSVWFQCSKNFEEDYWELISCKEDIKYILYSLGT